MNHNHNKQNGFTLIELLITVLILAILATIAYPTYQTYILNSRLENARADLLSITRSLEEYYTRHHSFSTLNDALNNPREINLKQNDYFDIVVDQTNTTADEYVLRANPKASKNPHEVRYLVLERGNITVCTPASGGTSNCVAF